MITRQRLEIRAQQKWDDLLTRTILNETRRGYLNNGGTFTCSSSASSTTVIDPLVTTNSYIVATAHTANAAAEVAAGVFRIPQSATSGQFVVHHCNNGVSDRTFNYGVLG